MFNWVIPILGRIFIVLAVADVIRRPPMSRKMRSRPANTLGAVRSCRAITTR